MKIFVYAFILLACSQLYATKAFSSDSIIFDKEEEKEQNVRVSSKFNHHEIKLLKTYRLYDIDNLSIYLKKADEDKEKYLQMAKVRMDYAESIREYLNVRNLDREGFDRKLKNTIEKIKKSIFKDELLKLKKQPTYLDVKDITERIFISGHDLYFKGSDIANLLWKFQRTRAFFNLFSLDAYKNHDSRVNNELMALSSSIKDAESMVNAGRNSDNESTDFSHTNERGRKRLNELLERKEQFENLKTLADCFIYQYLRQPYIEIKSVNGKSIECIPFKCTSSHLLFISKNNKNIYVTSLSSIDYQSKDDINRYIKIEQKKRQDAEHADN